MRGAAGRPALLSTLGNLECSVRDATLSGLGEFARDDKTLDLARAFHDLQHLRFADQARDVAFLEHAVPDMTDAGQLADHLLWASTTPAAANEDFNIVNGDVFRRSWMWGRIADWFGLPFVDFNGTVRPLEQQMAADAEVWRRLSARQGRPIEVVTDMRKSRKLGFDSYRATDEAFFSLFERLRADRLIPSVAPQEA